jgi:hypothetical protein
VGGVPPPTTRKVSDNLKCTLAFFVSFKYPQKWQINTM